jgi:leucyl-tRNA synthetase
LAKTTAKVTSDIESLQMNTAISALMILVNHLTSLPQRPSAAILQLGHLLAPFAPHLAEEIHSRLGGKSFASLAPWPTFRSEDLIEDTVEMPVQVNSRVKGKIQISPQATKDQIEETVRTHPDLSRWTAGKRIEKIIIVPGRIVNCICP